MELADNCQKDQVTLHRPVADHLHLKKALSQSVSTSCFNVFPGISLGQRSVDSGDS